VADGTALALLLELGAVEEEAQLEILTEVQDLTEPQIKAAVEDVQVAAHLLVVMVVQELL
jgi:hypothetical protein